MLRVYHLFLAAILLLLMPLGIRFVRPYFPGTKVEQNNPVASPVSKSSAKMAPGATPIPMSGNIWQKSLGKNVSVPSGWQVAPCQGNASLLCVSENSQVLGTVEINVYRVSQNPNFQKNLADAGVPFGSKLDYQNSGDQSKVIAALKAWVADYYASVSKDRQTAYGNQIVFSSHPLEEISIAQLPGIRYGFTGIKKAGGVQEQYISHVTFDGTVLYVITTAFDPDAVTGKFDKLENLVIFLPYLDAIAQNLNLS